MARIPREVIEEIVARSDVEEVIGRYVTLKRAGSNLNGLCPFHSEKSPSFTVFPATRSFYCFGCGAGGDVISFIMRAENLEYVPAVEFLADRAGITIPQTGEAALPGGVSRKRVFEMNLEAAKFFRACLFSEAGQEGMAYLHGSRQLSPATIKHFGLGFAPNSFNALGDHLHRLGFRDEELVAGYLRGISQKTGRGFDLFRNRVMFPIIDTAGNIVAFGGRVMDDSKPKYLNSSDTPGFKKSRNLFALNYAKGHCAEELILCEGYMDVIALHAAGFENAVATLGTAITAEHARLMAKYTQKVIINYDSDEAGQNAADKAMRILGEVGLPVRVLKLEGAKDPDEYIKKFGADGFRRALNSTSTGFEFKLQKILAKYNLEQPEDRIRASEEVCGVIAGVWSGVEREIYGKMAAERLGLPAEVIGQDVERIRRRRLQEAKKKQGQDAYSAARNFGDRVNPDAARYVHANAAEEQILGLLLLYPEHRSAVLSGTVELTAEDFLTAFGRRVFEAVLAEEAESPGNFSLSMLSEIFTPEEMGKLEGMVQSRRKLTRNDREVLTAACAALRQSRSSEDLKKTGSLQELLASKRRKDSAGES